MTIDVSPIAQKIKRSITWRILIGAVLLALAAYLMFDAHHRRSCAVRLQREIRRRNGQCEFGTPPLQRVQHLILDNGVIFPSYVQLSGPEFDRDWFKNTSNLWGLRVECLIVEESQLIGADVAKLLGDHPVNRLSAPGLINADDAAAAMGRADRTHYASLRDSDLSDVGLRSLPLERLRQLDIAGSTVTAGGMRELRRCESLVELTIDGRQLDRNTVRLFSAMPSLQSLSIVGSEVTDKHVRLLQHLQIPMRIRLDSRSVSAAAVDELHTVLRQRFQDGTSAIESGR